MVFPTPLLPDRMAFPPAGKNGETRKGCDTAGDEISSAACITSRETDFSRSFLAMEKMTERSSWSDSGGEFFLFQVRRMVAVSSAESPLARYRPASLAAVAF